MRSHLGTFLFALLTSTSALSCSPPTLAEFHRGPLLEIARGQLDCESAAIEVTDSTPEGFEGYLHDPDAKRYTVVGCRRRRTYLCYVFPYSQNPAVECQLLSEQSDTPSGEGVRLGPIPVR